VDQEGLTDKLVYLVHLVKMENLDQWDHQDKLANEESQDIPVLVVTKVNVEVQEHLEKMVLTVFQDLGDPQDLLA